MPELTRTNNQTIVLSREDKDEITKLFEGKFLIDRSSNDEMTIRWSDGGILFIRVKKERIYK